MEEKPEEHPADLEALRPSVTESRAASVEWPSLKTDWLGLRRALCMRTLEAWLGQAFPWSSKEKGEEKPDSNSQLELQKEVRVEQP